MGGGRMRRSWDKERRQQNEREEGREYEERRVKGGV